MSFIEEDRERARRDALSPNYYGDGEKGAPDKLTTFADALQCHKSLSYDHHMLYYRFEKLVKHVKKLEKRIKTLEALILEDNDVKAFRERMVKDDRKRKE